VIKIDFIIYIKLLLNMSSITQKIIECPICREEKISYVVLECSHKICLKCYHNCIYHNHSKCSLCRKNIPELAETCELIKDVEQDVEDLEKRVDELEDMNKDLEDLVERIDGEKEDIQDKYDEIWAQIN